MAVWHVGKLPDERLGEAWPLLRLHYAGLTLDQWQAEARSLITDEAAAGVYVAQTSTGYIYAVCAFLVEPDRSGGNELYIPLVAYVQLNTASDPLACLLEQVEVIARRHGCRRIRAHGHPIVVNGDTARWAQLGYECAGDDLTKDIALHFTIRRDEHASIPHR